MKTKIVALIVLPLALSLAACGDTWGERAVTGGAIGTGLFFASGRIAALIGANCGLNFKMTRVSPLSFVFSEYASIKTASTVRLTPAAGSTTCG